MLVDSQIDLMEDNHSMRFLIGQVHGTVLASRADHEDMAGNLSQVESYSHTLEDHIVSLHEEVNGIRRDPPPPG